MADEDYLAVTDAAAVDHLHGHLLTMVLRMCLWRVPDCAVDAAEVRFLA